MSFQISKLKVRSKLRGIEPGAIKFTGQGEVQVNIESKETADNLWTVAFAVKGTGIGIPKENLDRLFIPFSQVDTSTTRRFGGTGLGLVICKRLIEIMGGEIWVESEADIGSTFHFKVDLIGAGEKEAVSEYAMDNQVDHKFAENAPLNILVAEDEPANQKLIGEILAEDGLGVIDRLKEKAYNLILLDIQMQNMDGLEVARRIRDGQCGEERSAIYLIAITAYASKNDREKCLDAGMNDYIAKPILIGQIKDSLARAYQTISAG